MDSIGSLVDGEGRYVQGVHQVGGGDMENPAIIFGTATGIITIPSTASSMSIGQDGTVYFVDVVRGAYGEPVMIPVLNENGDPVTILLWFSQWMLMVNSNLMKTICRL